MDGSLAENPDLSSVDGAKTVVELGRDYRIEAAFVLRFVAIGLVMAFANVVPYLLTHGDAEFAAFGDAGWPLTCYSLGERSPWVHFSPWAMAGNIAIAVVVSAFAGWIFRDGELRTLRRWRIWATQTFRKLRTWGTPYAE